MGEFFIVKNDCKLTFERKEDGLKAGTVDIIRLIGSRMIVNKVNFQLGNQIALLAPNDKKSHRV